MSQAVGTNWYMTLAQRFRALRERLGLSQEEVAQRAGYSTDKPAQARVYVSKIETGKNKLSSADAREQAAQGFGLTVPQLFAYLGGIASLEDTAAMSSLRAGSPTPASTPTPRASLLPQAPAA